MLFIPVDSGNRLPMKFTHIAAEVLAPEDVVRLLTSHVPGLHVSESEPDSYKLESARVCLDVDRWSPSLHVRYPWILAQPWYRRTDAVVQYELSAHDDDDQKARRQVE